MKYLFFCLCILGGIAAPLQAQEPRLPPLPEGPLLKRAPDFSTWTITVQRPPSQGHPSPAAEAKPADGKGEQEKLAVTGRSNVTKIGTTILEDNFDAKGKRTEVWHFGTIRVLKLPDGSDPIVSPDVGGGGDIYSVNFAVADFAGLDWVSAKTYAGMTKYQGRDCIQFKGSVSPLEAAFRSQEASAIDQAKGSHQSGSGEMKVPAVACIDLETRLPLFVTFGEEQRTYQYGTPSTTSFALPSEVVASLKAYAERIKRVSAPAARAF